MSLIFVYSAKAAECVVIAKIVLTAALTLLTVKNTATSAVFRSVSIVVRPYYRYTVQPECFEILLRFYKPFIIRLYIEKAFKSAFDKEERIHIILIAGLGSCWRTMHGDFWDKLRNLPSMKQLRLIFSAWFHCRCCNIQRESFLTLQEDFVVPLEHDKLQVFAFISSKERQETDWHETDCLYQFKRTVRDYRNELVSWAFRNIKHNYKQIRGHLWLVIHFNA